jgi:phosphatidylglycerol:prolipoprotein diacylglycerol transferase
MISSFVGARFMHVFFEETEFYRDHPENIFKFWNGGFVYYGGALLSAFCSIYFLKKKCKSLLNNYLDLFTPVLSLAYGLGRLACLLAGCCYGKTCELPWALEGRHPTQAYASLWELGVLVILLKLESISRRPAQNTFLRTKGSLFYLWLILHGIGRLIMENYREDFRGPIWMMSISSWMSLAIILIGLFWFLKLRSKNNSKTISL